MKIKKPIMYMIAIAIMGLLITSASSIPTTKSSNEDEIGAEYLVVKCQPLLKKNIDKSARPLSFESVQMTGGDYDEFHPSVAGAPGGGFYAMTEQTEDGYTWQIWLYGSADGTTWDPILSTTAFNNAQYTDMDQNAYGTYGTSGAPPDTSGQIMILQGEIEDGWVWDWSTFNMNQFSNNRIACYTFEGPAGDPGTWNWGGATLTGYNNYNGANIVGCPFIFYQTTSDGYATIGWLTGTVSGCEHTGSAMDLARNILYSVYDRDTGTGWELLLRKDNFGTWQQSGESYRHPYMTSTKVNDSVANLTFPSVAAYDNNVIVACNKDSDVVVYYSTNGFSSKTEVLVQTSASYPEVTMAAEGVVVLTYIRDNVLRYRTSDTGGATWSEEQDVSDNQVNLNDRAANLDEFGGNVYGTWEDTRNANIDAYFDIVYEFVNYPPLAPTIDGPPKVKKNVDYTYTFSTTDPENNSIYYLVEWGDGTNTGWLGPFASGASFTANHTWTAKGEVILRCTPKDEFNEIGPFTELSVKVPRARFINLRFLDLFPNAFPLLRLIFGY